LTVLLRGKTKSKNTFAKIKYDSTKEREENRRQRTWGWKFAGTQLQKYKTYGLYFLISIMLIGSGFTSTIT
jgi:hypothetical protein